MPTWLHTLATDSRLTLFYCHFIVVLMHQSCFWRWQQTVSGCWLADSSLRQPFQRQQDPMMTADGCNHFGHAMVSIPLFCESPADIRDTSSVVLLSIIQCFVFLLTKQVWLVLKSSSLWYQTIGQDGNNHELWRSSPQDYCSMSCQHMLRTSQYYTTC